MRIPDTQGAVARNYHSGIKDPFIYVEYQETIQAVS